MTYLSLITFGFLEVDDSIKGTAKAGAKGSEGFCGLLL
jgi:hypothetical protein